MEKDGIYGKRRDNLWNEFFEAERLWEQNTEARQRWPEEVGTPFQRHGEKEGDKNECDIGLCVSKTGQ